MAAIGDSTLTQIENSALTSRQKMLIGAAVVGNMLEFFDLFLIGFVLNIIAGPWGLTFGESSFVLMTAGVGAIVGAFLFGHLADKIGRRKTFIATVLTFSVATGLMAAIPEGNWIALGILRFVVGLGVGGLIAVDLPLVQEFVPSKRRGVLSGLVVLLVPAGLLLGSVAATTLGPVLGWRGLVLLGLVPAVLTLFVRTFVPESPRWLIQQGRLDDARDSVAWALKLRREDVDLGDTSAPPVAHRWLTIFRYRRSITLTWLGSFGMQTAFYGFTLWAPTLIALQLGVSPARAAFLNIFIAVAGIGARYLWSVIGDRFGRRHTATALAIAGAACLLVTGLTHEQEIAGIAVFYPMLILSFVFIDGIFAVMIPYHGEVFPTALRSSGFGSAYGFGGVGKILGPAALAVISGAGTLVQPQATLAALPGAFTLLAGGSLLVVVANVLFGINTHGRTLEELDAQAESQRTDTPAHHAAGGLR
jgi:MFS transporter, putative metabolite:H+ symporter